jgi:hypothetical protein
VLEAVAAAGRAPAVARVEAERADRVAALDGERLAREALADRVECTDVARRIRPRRASDGCLIDHHDVVDVLCPDQCAMRTGRLRRLALGATQAGIEHILHQRRFARPRHAGDAHESPQRNRDVDSLQIVLGRTDDLDARIAR